MFSKSLSALLLTAACHAALPTRLYEIEQVVQDANAEDIIILFSLDSEFFYDDSLGDMQRLV